MKTYKKNTMSIYLNRYEIHGVDIEYNDFYKRDVYASTANEVAKWLIGAELEMVSMSITEIEHMVLVPQSEFNLILY